METILLEDFLDEGIIKEKSFREKINLMDFSTFSKKKSNHKRLCRRTGTNLGLFDYSGKCISSSR